MEKIKLLLKIKDIDSPSDKYRTICIKYYRKNRIAWLCSKNLRNSWTNFCFCIANWSQCNNSLSYFLLGFKTSIECIHRCFYVCKRRTSIYGPCVDTRTDIRFISNSVGIGISQSKALRRKNTREEKGNDEYFFHTQIVAHFTPKSINCIFRDFSMIKPVIKRENPEFFFFNF